MTTTHTAFVLAVLIKACVSIAAIAGAVYLASNNHNGWGWLILVSILAAPGSIKTNDEKPETEVSK